VLYVKTLCELCGEKINFIIMKKRIPFLLTTCLLFLFACAKSYYFEKAYDIPDSGWTYDNSLAFEVEIKDTSSIYNLYLNIDHSMEYAYQNMYVTIHTHFPKGEKLQEKFSINLATKAGVWQGECGSTSCQLQIPIQEGAFFNQAGTYTFTVEQFMRESPLKGIEGISLAVEDTGVKK